MINLEKDKHLLKQKMNLTVFKKKKKEEFFSFWKGVSENSRRMGLAESPVPGTPGCMVPLQLAWFWPVPFQATFALQKHLLQN